MGAKTETNGTTWHVETGESVLQAVESNLSGLTNQEARDRLKTTGPNVLPRVSRESVLDLAFRQINNPLIYVLLASAVVALVMGKVVDGLVVLGVVVLNMIIGFIQEYRAGKAIEGLIDLVPEYATTMRDNVQVSLLAAELVPGDIIRLQAGDKVPADLRLIKERSLKVQEATLTGESEPVSKSPDPVEPGASLGDRFNMLYSGTLVTYGTGTAVVVETGARTELGRISDMLRDATEIETPLTRQIARVGKILTLAISVVALLLLGVGLLRGYPLVDAILASITLAVAAIPEGLPAIITIALAIGVQRMARRRAIIRKLPAVETLGSTTIICSDKTGTLTRGEMTVRSIWTPKSGSFELSGVGYRPEGVLSSRGKQVSTVPDDVTELLRAGILCNDSNLVLEGNTWRITGDTTEGALIVAAEKLGYSADETRNGRPRNGAIPFESERQYMATLNESPDGRRYIYIKGAPEIILARCGSADTSQVQSQVEIMARAGMRVLAFAVRSMENDRTELDESDTEGGFEFLGLQAMIDPPRPEAIESIKACHRAGINVKMITGDHRLTAEAIGQQLGLLDRSGPVYSGDEIQAMDDVNLSRASVTSNVFARVAPEHKLRLVRSLQKNGHVVAMTGDGVNDAPALKQADIGVAMGITGTAVSKESADMVLADDNFSSIAAAVEEGRRVYDNLIKSLAFVLPTNIGEALIILLAVMFAPIVNGSALLPMEPVQILWINLVATVALALPLAFEVMEPGIMSRPPRHPGTPILGSFVIVRTILVAILMAAGAIGLFFHEYSVRIAGGMTPEQALRLAQTIAVTTVIFFQIFYLVQCRSLQDTIFAIGLWSNKWIYAGISGLLLLQAAFIYLPIMHVLFGSAPLDAMDLVKSVAVALIVLPVISLEKWIRNRRNRNLDRDDLILMPTEEQATGTSDLRKDLAPRHHRHDGLENESIRKKESRSETLTPES